MRHGVKTLGPVLAVALLLGVPESSTAQERPPATTSLSDFGLEVFRGVSWSADSPNVVFSPVSVGLAAALLAEGAMGETRAELLRAFGLNPGEWGTFEAGIRRFLEDVEADTTAVVRIGTSLWADEEQELGADFRSRAERYHRALVRTADLQNPGTAKLVNDWASQATNGKITGVMPQPRASMELLLLNAVYFKGLWDQTFDTAETRPGPFVLQHGDTVIVPTMHRTAEFEHFVVGDAEGVRIPYRGRRFAAYVVLPVGEASVREVERSLTVADVSRWANGATPMRVSLSVPRVRHRGTWDLLEPLRRVGVRRALSFNLSELDGLWARPRLPVRSYVSDAAQSTFLAFDEEGTEAAAVTRLGIVPTSALPEPLEFRVDRPFLLVLRDETSGAILFVARIGDPRSHGSP
jgi:serpin B